MASRLQIDRLHISAGRWTDSAVRQMYKQALDEGADDERERLRPLLDRCAEWIDSRALEGTAPYQERAEALLADLRRELGREE